MSSPPYRTTTNYTPEINFEALDKHMEGSRRYSQGGIVSGGIVGLGLQDVSESINSEQQQHPRKQQHPNNKKEWDDPKLSYVSRLFITLQTCIQQLKHPTIELSDTQLEEMSIFIHTSMSSNNRNYHSVQHVFDISKDIVDPIGILACLFHDCVYFTVDGDFTDQQEVALRGNYIKTIKSEGRVSLMFKPRTSTTTTTTTPTKDEALNLPLVQSIFGFAPQRNSDLAISFLQEEETERSEEDHQESKQQQPKQQPLEFHLQDGLNEFYSALIAVRYLHDYLSIEQLAKITCCIQATIPFRNHPTPKNTKTDQDHPNSTRHMIQLYKNLVKTKKKFQLQIPHEEIIATVQLAAQIANADIGNFGSPDRNYFIDNTWSLLPELNIKLRAQYLYTVQEFQEAMHKMNGFFHYFLNPNVCFASFHNVPSVEEMQVLQAECNRNLQLGKVYVGAKYIASSILLAIALLTGGANAPMSMFMGDLPDRHYDPSSPSSSSSCYTLEELFLRDHQQEMSNPNKLCDCNRIVYEILLNGRKKDLSFDIKRSPLAAYFYFKLGGKRMEELLQTHTLYPMEETNARKLLEDLPRECIHELIMNMKHLTKPRVHALQALCDSLPNS